MFCWLADPRRSAPLECPASGMDSRDRCYIFGVRRLIAICLLMLLPLQMSWAAVVSYCMHEADPQAQHLGHHGHGGAVDVAAVGADDIPANNAPSVLDADGCHSHGFCLGLPASHLVVLAQLPSAKPRAVADEATGALVANPPDRPQWARLA